MVRSFFVLGRALLLGRTRLALENLALRQQLAIYHRSIARPVINNRDRIFWVLLTRVWAGWREALIIVRPETVIRWHWLGSRLYWRWTCRGAKPGRPPVDMELIQLIRRMSQENPTWGAPRIRAELRLLGHDVAESTVANYMGARGRRPPSQTWRTLSAERSGQHLRRLVSLAHAGDGNQRGGDCLPFSLAELLRGASHRDDSSRVHEPSDRSQRESPSTADEAVRPLLQRVAAAFVAGGQLPDPA